jgi:hypothetical protein
LKPKLVKIIIRTVKKTQHFTIAKINWLTLFKEVTAVYSVNHTKHISTPSGQNTIAERQSRWYVLPFGLKRLMKV